jgi:negative regulator of sigma E activity
MARTTEEIYYLVKDVLKTIPEPYGEDITDEVCFAIENNPEWFRRY